MTRHPLITITLADGDERDHVATVAGLDRSLADDSLDRVRTAVVRAGYSHAVAALLWWHLDGCETIAAPIELHRAAELAAEVVLATLHRYRVAA